MVTTSIVIPTYNREQLVQKSINSVLNQTFGDFEIIVVDDCSEDNTQKVINNINDDRIRYIRHNENQGVGAARNTGIQSARGKYLAFLDSDDIWHPTKLEKQIQALEDSPDKYQIAYCGCTTRSESILKTTMEKFFPELKGKTGGSELICDILSQKLPVHPGSTLLLERDLLFNVDSFDSSLRRQEDLDFVANCLQRAHIIYLDEVLVQLHDTGRPETDTLVESREKFIKKSIQYIDTMEEYDTLVNSHRRLLANAYFRDGDFRKALKYLTRSKFNTKRDYASTIYHFFNGIKSYDPTQ